MDDQTGGAIVKRLGVLFGGFFFTLYSASAHWDWSSFSLFGTKAETSHSSDEAPNADVQRLQNFPALVEELESLQANLLLLHAFAQQTGLHVTPAQMLWKELLESKVLRQLRLRQALTIVVAGGTKSGKSTVFNHLATRRLSETSHIAAATKQAVLTVPDALYDLELIRSLFAEMQVVENADAHAATEDSGKTHKLLLRRAKNIPKDMMLVDIPDVDSENRDNWEKAYRTARASDVVIAMITPEKHGDEATNAFFRSVAAEAGKPIVLVINKVHEQQLQRGQWQDWLKVFCKSTGITPQRVYVVPFDMDAAEAGKQAFFQVEGNLALAVKGEGSFTISKTPSSLHSDLQEFNISNLKAQSMLGSLRQALHGGNQTEGSLEEYLNLIRKRSAVYQQTLSSIREGAQTFSVEWPTPPPAILRHAVMEWWHEKHRSDLTKAAMRLTSLVGLEWLGKTQAKLRAENAILAYNRDQLMAIDQVIAQTFNALSPVLSDSMNYLSPEAAQTLSPLAQGRLVAELKKAYAEERRPVEDFDSVAAEQLPLWAEKNPWLMTMLQAGDITAEVVLRPAVTVASTIAGMFLPANLAPIASSGGASIGSSVAGGVVGSKTMGILNEKAGEETSQRVFTDLTIGYATLQLNWINQWMANHHLAKVLAELEAGAAIANSNEFRTAESCAARLTAWLEQTPSVPTTP